jgi:hypothetical protein
MAVVLATALNGIAVLQAYFTIFTGKRHTASISLRRRRSEQIAVLALALLIFAGGFLPEPGVVSRHQAATQLLAERAESGVRSTGNGVQNAESGVPGSSQRFSVPALRTPQFAGVPRSASRAASTLPH